MNKLSKVTIHVSKFWDSLELPPSQPCFICGEQITKVNVGAFAPINGKVEVICGKLKCFVELETRRKMSQATK